jgi:hypothetical protein
MRIFLYDSLQGVSFVREAGDVAALRVKLG